jgi:hypothetical protein
MNPTAAVETPKNPNLRTTAAGSLPDLLHRKGHTFLLLLDIACQGKIGNAAKISATIPNAVRHRCHAKITSWIVSGLTTKGLHLD